jgi:arabinogalactan oligomer / maltooligosaccharide transport system permease protein
VNSNAKTKNLFITILIYLEIIFMCIVVIYPILWIVGTSFGSTGALATSTIIPKNPTISNYVNLFTKTNYATWYFNTFQIAFLTMAFTVVISTLTSYVFSRFKFKGKKGALLFILCIQMFPSFLGMSAIYMLFFNMGLLDNIYALVILYVGGRIPFDTWLMKGYLANIPMSIDEAAMIDGASRLRIFIVIILPLAVPMITFLAVTAFMSPWMDYIFPRLLLSSDSKRTLAVGLFELLRKNANTSYGQFSAGAVLVALPITALYMTFQKYLITGLASGANKE